MAVNARSLLLDVEVYDNFGDGHWAQSKYLVHGYDDVYWVNTSDEVAQIIKDSLLQWELYKGGNPLENAIDAGVYSVM